MYYENRRPLLPVAPAAVMLKTAARCGPPPGAVAPGVFLYGIVCGCLCTRARSDAGSARRGVCSCLSFTAYENSFCPANNASTAARSSVDGPWPSQYAAFARTMAGSAAPVKVTAMAVCVRL